MAFNKRTWKGRQGTGLNKFSINGASPVTVVNQPDSITEVGDALSAGNLNDLEDRIADAFDETASQEEVTSVKNALTAIDHRVENLEQAKGSYVVQNYKDGSITPSGKGAWAIVEGLRGVSRVENRLPLESPRDISTTGVDITYNSSTGKFTITGQAGANSSVWLSPFDGVIAGHVYLIGNTAPNVKMYLANISEYGQYILPTALATSQYLGIRLESGKTYNDTFEVIVKDISVYFNGSIPSDADTIAEIQQNYPHLLIPSEYGIRIVDSSYSGVRAYSRNLFNYADFEVGDIASDTGANVTSSTAGRSKEYIPVKPNTLYYFKDATVNPLKMRYYDINKNYIGFSDKTGGTNAMNQTRLMPDNCFYIRFAINGVTSIAEDAICVNLSDSNDGTFTPYFTDTLSLSYSGKSAGAVAEMYYPETGEQTKPIGSIADLSTLNWGKNTNGQFYAILPIAGVSDTTGSNVLCTKYLGGNAYGKADKTICINGSTNSILWVCDLAIDSASDLKTALTGVPLYYELATPDPSTFVTPIIDNTLLTESGGRMATVQTGTVVDGSFDMGFINL